MATARIIARIIAFADGGKRRELLTRRGAELINCTSDRDTNVAAQGNTTGRRLAGSPHAGNNRCYGLGQSGWHPAPRMLIQFIDGKAHPISCTTGAAGLTGIHAL